MTDCWEARISQGAGTAAESRPVDICTLCPEPLLPEALASREALPLKSRDYQDQGLQRDHTFFPKHFSGPWVQASNKAGPSVSPT